MDLLEYYPMVGSRVHERPYMLSSPSAVKRGWHLKDLHTELYVKQMGDGVIRFQGAMVRKINIQIVFYLMLNIYRNSCKLKRQHSLFISSSLHCSPHIPRICLWPRLRVECSTCKYHWCAVLITIPENPQLNTRL